MLSQHENDILTQVGPGTMMGDMMRQYWIPALMSTELPSADCPPVRLRLLGENLIGFRTTSGATGIVVNSCPHRGASMFFGRNEVRIRAYPTEERNGVIWVYMGPREEPPPLPGLEPNMKEGGTVQKFLRDCSWLQSFEGDLDTTHIGFLHFGHVKAEDVEPGS